MATEARHHHYIPQAYLKGFACERTEKQWYSNVTDLLAQRTYVANVRNICGERDFMRIEIEGHSPDAIENGLSSFENKGIEAIRRVSDSGTFYGDDANWTLNLMALLAVRSPEMRENQRDFHEQVAKRILDVTLASKERWDGQVAKMQADGIPVNDATYEEIKAFHKNEQYKVTVAREYQIGTEFKMMETVLHALGKRQWSIYRTDGRSGEFLTTNRPVTLTYNSPEKIPLLYRNSPGFACPDTEVYFPLNRHSLLIGRFDRKEEIADVPQHFIAAVNTHMMMHCFGKAFSTQQEILYVDIRDQLICHDSLLLEKIKLWKAQEDASKE